MKLSIFLIMLFCSAGAVFSAEAELLEAEIKIGESSSGTENQATLYNSSDYDITLSNGNPVELYQLAGAMGLKDLAWKLKFAKYYDRFVAADVGFISATVLSGVSGAFLLFAYIGKFSGKSILEDKKTSDDQVFLNDNILAISCSLFGVAAIGIAGIISFTYLLIQTKSYRFKFIQAQSLVKQYNEFVRKKMNNVSFDINYNPISRSPGFVISMTF